LVAARQGKHHCNVAQQTIYLKLIRNPGTLIVALITSYEPCVN